MTSVQVPRPRQSPLGHGRVLVMSRLLLVAQTIEAALSERGLSAEAVPWETGAPPVPSSVSESDLVLMLDDQVDNEAMLAAMAMIATSPAAWVVLSRRPQGAVWQELLTDGAFAVLPSDSKMSDVEDVIARARRGAPAPAVPSRPHPSLVGSPSL